MKKECEIVSLLRGFDERLLPTVLKLRPKNNDIIILFKVFNFYIYFYSFDFSTVCFQKIFFVIVFLL